MVTIAAGFLWLILLSALRAWWTGSPAPDEPKLRLSQDIVLHILMAPALAAVCWAYLKLWFEPPPFEARRQVLAWGLALAAVAALALPLTSNDVFGYLAYGRMLHLGLDPARLGPQVLPPGDPFRALVSYHWVMSPSVYGPASLAVFWLSTTTGAVWSSLFVYRLLSLLTAWAAIVLAYRLCTAVLPKTRVPAALVLTIVNPLFLWEVGGQGHNDGFMVVCTLAAVALLFRNRFGLSALGLALGVLVKSAVAPALFFLAVWRMPRLRDRYYWGACALGAALVGLALWTTPSLLLAIDAPLRGADVAKRLCNSVPALLFSTASFAEPAAALDAYRIYWTLSVAGVAAFVIYAGRRTATRQDVLEHSLRTLLLMAVVFSPNLQPWYFVWMLPFAGLSTSEPLQRLMVFTSAGFLLLYAAPLGPPAWLLSAGVWLGLLTIVGSELEAVRTTVQATSRTRRAAAAERIEG